MTTTSVIQPCPYCGMTHQTTCPLIEEMEFYPDGVLKRVRFKGPAPVPISPHPRPRESPFTWTVPTSWGSATVSGLNG